MNFMPEMMFQNCQPMDLNYILLTSGKVVNQNPRILKPFKLGSRSNDRRWPPNDALPRDAPHEVLRPSHDNKFEIGQTG